MLDNTLKKILELDLKQTEILDEYTYNLYRTLVIELTKIRVNISEGYSMSCKRLIKRILTDYRLKEFLVANKVIDDIEKIIN